MRPYKHLYDPLFSPYQCELGLFADINITTAISNDNNNKIDYYYHHCCCFFPFFKINYE